MAEILNSGVNHYFKDIASEGGNTIIGAAVPTDFATQGISKEAGESGVFVYTDKSFTIYFCYGGTWVEYMAVDATDSDFANSISIPWADHDTHGAVTGMYFVTAEADHEIRAVKISGDLITDFIPTDADLTKNALIVDETSVSNTGSVIEGAGTYFNYEHDLSGKSVGDTISYTLNGVVGGALTFMDTYTQVQTSILYNAETGQSAISFVLPADWDSSKAINTFSRGGSPLADPFTRSVTVPTSGLNYHMNMNVDPQKADGSFPADGESVMAFGGAGSAATNNGSPIRYSSVYQWGAGGNTVEVNNAFLDFTSNKLLTPNGLDFSSEGATVAFAMVEGRYDENDSHTLRFTDGNEKGIQFLFDKSGHSTKIKVFFRLNAANTKYGFISDDYVITDTAMHTIIATADGDGNLTVKVDGVAIAMSSMVVPNIGWTPHINGHFHLGDYATYNGVLSGTDLEQLEAYFDFKYITLPSMEAMFQDLSTNYAGGFNGVSPVDSDYIDGVVSNMACYAYPEKYFKLGTRAEMKISYAAVHASSYNQYFIIPQSKWNFMALARNYDYVPAYQVRYSPEMAYGVYHRNYGSGVMYAVESGNDNFVYLNHPGAPTGKVNPGDTVGFIVEWDGTMKLTKNDVVIFTYPDKLTEDFIFAPIGVFSDWKLDMSGHMEDFDAMDAIYGRFEGAELVTPTIVEDNGIEVSLGGINANVATLGGKLGNVTIGSLQGAGSYIEFVNANHPVGPHQTFELIIDTDSSNFTFANAPYGIKRNLAHESQFYVGGSYADGGMHFASRPFFGEWPYWHPAVYWETHGEDDTVENKTVGPCRIQLMEGDKLVCFVNDYPVWEQAGFDVSQKWYFNLRNFHNAGASFENIKIKSVQ